jgi:preprotein translocase subunit SecD
MACREDRRNIRMRKYLTWRILVLVLVIIFSLLAIQPSFQDGVYISDVAPNSTELENGLRQGQIIESIDGQKVSSLQDYANIISRKFPSEDKVKTTFSTKEGDFVIFTNSTPDIVVSKLPKTKLQTGLDLQGGARALIKAKDHNLTSGEVSDLISITNNRFNVYGISDIQISSVTDLSGSNFMLIEIAGATPSDLEQLISQQGKFEARIGNETVFIGGQKDINSVCKNDATCAGISSCNAIEGGEVCTFFFTVYLSEEAAKRHAEITSKLDVQVLEQGRYLSQPLDLYVDDQLVDSLLISDSLKGRETTQIQISGSGSGITRNEAIESAEKSMQTLQTILITGSLPYQLEIVKLDTISPKLGEEFIRAILLAGILALVAVSILTVIRYRNLKIASALLITSFAELIIILGVAALIRWNLDLPSIAGILATIGTGVDQQIVILDESRQKISISSKEKVSRALTIIIGAYFTSLVSLLPLLTAGAGLLKGFAVTTLIGTTAGIIITRPAFADMIKSINK